MPKPPATMSIRSVKNLFCPVSFAIWEREYMAAAKDTIDQIMPKNMDIPSTSRTIRTGTMNPVGTPRAGEVAPRV